MNVSAAKLLLERMRGVDSIRKSPPSPSRLTAQWRQIDNETREARIVRAQWMCELGCDFAELQQACNEYDLSLVEELEQLAAVRMLAQQQPKPFC